MAYSLVGFLTRKLLAGRIQPRPRATRRAILSFAILGSFSMISSSLLLLAQYISF
jgi:hypothetical protein